MIRLAQLLCRSRHTLLAIAFDPCTCSDAFASYALGLTMAELIQQDALEHRCALCGSRSLAVEITETPFATLEEASPHIASQAAANGLFRELAARDPLWN
jgi:hypothetical protein